MQIKQTGISFGTAASDKILAAYNQKMTYLAESKGKTKEELSPEEKIEAFIRMRPDIDEFSKTVMKELKDNNRTAEYLVRELNSASIQAYGGIDSISSIIIKRDKAANKQSDFVKYLENTLLKICNATISSSKDW